MSAKKEKKKNQKNPLTNLKIARSKTVELGKKPPQPPPKYHPPPTLFSDLQQHGLPFQGYVGLCARAAWMCSAEGQTWHPWDNGPDATCSFWLQVNCLEDELIYRKILQDTGYRSPHPTLA